MKKRTVKQLRAELAHTKHLLRQAREDLEDKRKDSVEMETALVEAESAIAKWRQYLGT